MTLPSTLSAPWLAAPSTQAVFEALEGGGFTARAVGGIVRNTLLGLPPTDIDIATGALPADTIRLATAAGLKTFPTGLAHGTITVISKGVTFEVTTLRRDVTTDGRHAQVAFTNDWSQDAARRDFTINALYCDRHGALFDPLGGAADLSPVKIRFIGDAGERIREDYLRILRFFRFSATYCAEGKLDAEGLAACATHRAGLERISGERIQTEMLNLLAASHAVLVTKALVDAGIYAALFDTASYIDDFSRLATIEAEIRAPADPVRRLAALSVSKTSDATCLDRRLKLSLRDRNRLVAAAKHSSAITVDTDLTAARAALYRMGVTYYVDAVLLNWARSGHDARDLAFMTLATLPDRWEPPVMPITGTDAIAQGVAPGPAIGKLMAAVEADWIAGGFIATRTDLLADLQRRLANLPE